MVIGLLNCGSFIVHILLLGTSKVFTFTVFLPCACVHVLLPGTRRFWVPNPREYELQFYSIQFSLIQEKLNISLVETKYRYNLINHTCHRYYEKYRIIARVESCVFSAWLWNYFWTSSIQVAVIIVQNSTCGIGNCVRARTHGHVTVGMHTSNVASCKVEYNTSFDDVRLDFAFIHWSSHLMITDWIKNNT